MNLALAHLEEHFRPQTPPQRPQAAPAASSLALELRPPASRVRAFSAKKKLQMPRTNTRLFIIREVFILLKLSVVLP